MRFNQLQPTVITSSTTGAQAAAPLLAPEGRGMIGSMYTHIDRANKLNNTWTTNGPWTTFSTVNAYQDNSLVQFVNMLTGDGLSDIGTSQAIYISESETESSRIVQWSNGNRIGHARTSSYRLANATTYPGATLRVLPIRNTSSAAISIPVSAYVTATATDGSCAFVLTPAGNKYSAPGLISSTLIGRVASSTASLNIAGNITVPGNTTVLLCVSSSDYYLTTYQFTDVNFLVGLNTMFASSSIICDMRMLSSLVSSRFNISYAGAANGTALLAPLWTVTAQNYGDR